MSKVQVFAWGEHPMGAHITLYLENVALERVASMLRHLRAAQDKIEWHLSECSGALSEGRNLQAGIDVRFSIDLDPFQTQGSLIESLTYQFSEQVAFQRKGADSGYPHSDNLRFPELGTQSWIAGYSLLEKQATLGIQLELVEGGEDYGDMPYGRLPERGSTVSIVSQNFRDALLIREKVKSEEFLGRLADIARVNGATELTQYRFDSAEKALKSPFISIR